MYLKIPFSVAPGDRCAIPPNQVCFGYTLPAFYHNHFSLIFYCRAQKRVFWLLFTWGYRIQFFVEVEGVIKRENNIRNGFKGTKLTYDECAEQKILWTMSWKMSFPATLVWSPKKCPIPLKILHKFMYFVIFCRFFENT